MKQSKDTNKLYQEIKNQQIKEINDNSKKLAYASISNASSSVPADDFYKTGLSINFKLRNKADDQNIQNELSENGRTRHKSQIITQNFPIIENGTMTNINNEDASNKEINEEAYEDKEINSNKENTQRTINQDKQMGLYL